MLVLFVAHLIVRMPKHRHNEMLDQFEERNDPLLRKRCILDNIYGQR